MAQAQTADINLGEVLRQVAREKEIDYERWVLALEDAMASAAKKQHRIKEPVRAHWNADTGKFDADHVAEDSEPDEGRDRRRGGDDDAGDHQRPAGRQPRLAGAGRRAEPRHEMRE